MFAGTLSRQNPPERTNEPLFFQYKESIDFYSTRWKKFYQQLFTRCCNNSDQVWSSDSVRGTEVSQGSRLKAVLPPVERRRTELHHAPLWTRCCHTWASHKGALSTSGTGQGTGCCSLEETGSSCLSRSGTQESAGSCSQTTGWCTDCMETWREGITPTILCLWVGVQLEIRDLRFQLVCEW